MPPKRGETQRRNLTYQEKMIIIRKKEEEPAWTQENLAMWAREQFKLSTKPTQATISNILRAKDKLMSMNVPPDFRSARPVKHPELDARMIRWVMDMLASNTPLTRDGIQQKAAALAQELQLANAITFSKGWVSSFMKRHQLHFRRRNGMTPGVETDMEIVRQSLANLPPMPGLPAMAAPPVDNGSVAVDDPNGVPVDAKQEPTRKPRLTTKRKRMTVWEGEHLSPETRVALGVLLEWVTVPGNYARWRTLKTAKDKEPLCEEINLLLRTRGMRDMTTTEIRVHIITFVKSFKAANSWLTETGLRDAFEMEKTTGGYDVKSHVVRLCQHYDALAPVLADFLDEVEEDEEMGLAEDGDLLIATAAAAAASASSAQQGTVGVDKDVASTSLLQLPPAKQTRKEPVAEPAHKPTAPNQPADKAQQQLLFDLECEKLKCDIEAKHVQLMLEKTLARKRLLDAGVSSAEVDKLFPL